MLLQKEFTSDSMLQQAPKGGTVPTQPRFTTAGKPNQLDVVELQKAMPGDTMLRFTQGGSKCLGIFFNSLSGKVQLGEVDADTQVLFREELNTGKR